MRNFIYRWFNDEPVDDNKNMTEYQVIYKNENEPDKTVEVFFSVKAAKACMKQHPGARGYKTKIYRNGEWEPMGEITLTGSNKSFLANSPRNMQKANY